jgi:hypothetical protein
MIKGVFRKQVVGKNGEEENVKAHLKVYVVDRRTLMNGSTQSVIHNAIVSVESITQQS